MAEPYLDCVRGLQAVMSAGAENRVDVREVGLWAKTMGILVSKSLRYDDLDDYLAGLKSA